jgi:hypothetical protein
VRFKTNLRLSGLSGFPVNALLLPGPRHILLFRSVTGRKTRWAQAHFFVGPVEVGVGPA